MWDAFALGGLLCAGSAVAQLSGSFAVVSDYRYRGVSLSDEKPAAQLSLAYDHPSGGYAGVFASSVELSVASGRELQVLPYAGYAWRADRGLGWEVGISYSAVIGASGYDYPEVYGGVASDQFSARLHYAPDYFGESVAALYAEVNADKPLVDRIHLLGHLGYLKIDGGSGCCRFDVRAAVALDLQPFSLQLGWVSSGSGGYGPPVENRHRHAWVLSASQSF